MSLIHLFINIDKSNHWHATYIWMVHQAVELKTIKIPQHWAFHHFSFKLLQKHLKAKFKLTVLSNFQMGHKALLYKTGFKR